MGSRKPNFDPPPFDLPPSYQRTSIFDDPAAVAALTGTAGAGAAGASAAAPQASPAAPAPAPRDGTPTTTSGTRPIIMGPREQPIRPQAPGAAAAAAAAAASSSQGPQKSLARSLTNNTPSFIMAASCPNPEFLSQLQQGTQAGLTATDALAAAAANADVVRRAQDMSMGRSPTIFSIMSGVEAQLQGLSLGNGGAGSTSGAAAPAQYSSRARSSFSGPLSGGGAPGGRVAMGPPGVAEEGEEEAADEDEDEDEDGDELAPAPLGQGFEEDDEQLQFDM